MKKLTVFRLFLMLIVGLGSVSCLQRSKTTEAAAVAAGTPVSVWHAELFGITHHNAYTTVVVFNPWAKGEVYARYYLVKNADTSVPQDGVKVQIPIKSLMTNSATHLGFLDLLNELNTVTGVCSADYIYNPTIRTGVGEGRIADLGDSFNLDIERLLLLRPQAVMTTAYNADDENSRKMKQTALNLIYNVEWQEKTLLGRAEWIKFVAAFYDKCEAADSIFTEIEARYNEVCQLATGVQHRPGVLSGQDFRGSWSMPGGQSFNAQLFRDAGADYHYRDNGAAGSISTTIEEALLHFNAADVWVGVQANTLEELARTDAKYKLFKAYKTGNVYNTNRRMNATGGNDYWEGAVARPDLLLSDMVKVFHPQLLPNYELMYLQKLTP